MSDWLKPDPAIPDPHGESLLEAQRLAAEKVQAANREWQRLRTRSAALGKVRDKAADFLAAACAEQPSLPLELGWMLLELSDAITAADDAENGE